MTAGRPEEYKEEYCKEVDKYLSETGHGTMHMPKVESFAIRLGFSKNTLYQWAKEHKEFQDALDKIMLFQGERLIDDGIYGGKEVNSTIVKLLLQNNHGMKERVDNTTNDQSIYQNLTDKQLDELIRSKTEKIRTTETNNGEGK